VQIFKIKPGMTVAQMNFNSGASKVLAACSVTKQAALESCWILSALPTCFSALNLNPPLPAEWAEPGENTFMREPLTWEAFRQVTGFCIAA
jgi:hypothetical protein